MSVVLAVAFDASASLAALLCFSCLFRWSLLAFSCLASFAFLVWLSMAAAPGISTWNGHHRKGTKAIMSNSNVPEYGTPEYAEWYRANVDPKWQPTGGATEPPQPPRKRRHVKRWIFGGLGAFVALIVGVSVAAGGGSSTNSASKAADTGSFTGSAPTTTVPRATHAPATRRPAATRPVATRPPATHTVPATHRPVATKPAPTHTAPATHAPTTHAPATHAPAPTHAAPPKPALTTSQEQAIESAESYLQMGGFSRAGLIDQLTSQYGEGFSEADAVYAVDHVTVDWNQQAVESAKSYLQMGGFSRASLIDQLTSPYGEKFTLAEATYAADHVGL